MKPKRHWRTAKKIVDDLMPVIWSATSRKKLEALPYETSSDFYYKLPDDITFIYYRLLRVKEWENKISAACSQSFNPFIDIYLCDYVFTFSCKEFLSWARTSLYHETIHAMQNRYDVFRKETPESRFDLPYSFWDDSKHAEERHIFYQQTTLAEMDACLGEFWCEHGYFPESENEVYDLIYHAFDLPVRTMRRVAKYVWGYYFEGKAEQLSKKRVAMFFNRFEKRCLPDQEIPILT